MNGHDAAALGYRVFPLSNGYPAITDWPAKATMNPPAHWDLTEYAIETTGLLVVDLDVNHDNGHDGFASWDALGLVGSDACVPTAREGVHMYWTLPKGVEPEEVRSSASKVAPGVDVKSWHSFVRGYGDLPPIAELMPAPGLLVEKVRKVPVDSTLVERSTGAYAAELHPYVRAALNGVSERLRGARDGELNDAQTHSALRLVELSNNPRSGLPLDEAYDAFLTACSTFDEKSQYRWDYAVEKLAGKQGCIPEDAPTTPEEVARVSNERAEWHYNETKAKELAQARIAEEQFAELELPEVLTLDEIVETSDQDWVIEGLQRSDSLISVIAPNKSGKTAFSANWAHSLVTGSPFLGLYDNVVPIEGKVAYLNYEVDVHELRTTLKDLGVPLSKVLHIGLEGRANVLMTKVGQDWLVAHLLKHDVRAMVIDPFSDASIGIVTDQNDAAQVNKFKAIVNDIRSRAGVTATLLNVHAGWGGDGHARGSSVLEDWPSAKITLKKDKQSRVVSFSIEGRRGVREQNNIPTAYDPVTARVTALEGSGKGGGHRKSTNEKKHDAAREVLLTAIADNPGLPKGKYVSTALETATGTKNPVGRSVIEKALDELIEAEKVVTTRGANNSMLCSLPA